MFAIMAAAARIGRRDYLAGLPLSANPYALDYAPARIYADAWLRAWMNNEKE